MSSTRLPLAGGFVAGLCVSAFVLQVIDPFAQEVSAFIPELVVRGELWRVFTAHFFHSPGGLPLHAGLNVVALLLLAVVVEGSLGAVRTGVVMGTSALGAMALSAVAGYAGVTGASGIVFGLLGAALCLQLRFGRELTGRWRLPPVLIVLVLTWEAGVVLFVPTVAGAAHVGGFVLGYGMTWGLASSASMRDVSPPFGVKLAGVAFGTAAIASFVATVPLILGNPADLERHGLRLLESTRVPATHYASLAGRIVAEPGATVGQRTLAVKLAARAVESTQDPPAIWLGILAEALFAIGDRSSALEVIEAALAKAPDDPTLRTRKRYYRGESGFPPRPGQVTPKS